MLACASSSSGCRYKRKKLNVRFDVHGLTKAVAVPRIVECGGRNFLNRAMCERKRLQMETFVCLRATKCLPNASPTALCR